MAVPLCQSGGCERDRREAKEQQHLCLGTSCDKGVDLDKNRSSYIARALVYFKQCLGTFVRKNVHGKQALMLTARLPIVANLACSRMEDCCYEPSIDSDEYLHHCKKTAGDVIWAGSTLSMLDSVMHTDKSPFCTETTHSSNVQLRQCPPSLLSQVSKHVY